MLCVAISIILLAVVVYNVALAVGFVAVTVDSFSWNPIETATKMGGCTGVIFGFVQALCYVMFIVLLFSISSCIGISGSHP